jgi:hypothetical protein
VSGPKFSAAAIVRAVRDALTCDRQAPPTPGSRAWQIEEALFYQHRQFRCHGCARVVGAEDGAADDMPDACSRCWNDAHGVDSPKRRRELRAAEKRCCDAAMAKHVAKVAADDAFNAWGWGRGVDDPEWSRFTAACDEAEREVCAAGAALMRLRGGR